MTADFLKALLSYDPTSGLFTWLVDRGPARVGDTAGTLEDSGYIRINVGGRPQRAHRLAFLYMIGDYPKHNVDHVNGNRRDNRWANLREAPFSLNQENQKRPAVSNKIGLLGVCRPANRRFKAQIMVRKKQHHLGYFDTPEEAHAAYLDAKRRVHAGCTL